MIGTRDKLLDGSTPPPKVSERLFGGQQEYTLAKISLPTLARVTPNTLSRAGIPRLACVSAQDCLGFI